MAFCPNCGAQASGSYCPNCGTSLGSSGPVGSGSTLQAQGLTDNVAGALCYFPFLIGLIIDIVMLLIAPYNRSRSVRFHALQSLFLHGALFVLWIIVPTVLGVLAMATHGVGLFAGFGIYPLLSLCVIALFVYLMYETYNGRKVKLPFIGDLADKHA